LHNDHRQTLNAQFKLTYFCEDGVGWNPTWFTPSIFLKLPERIKDAKNKNKAL
jgi:hypothetical protein